MKQIFKFRAYNKQTGKMMMWKDIKSFGNLNKLLTLSFVEVMQCTGLKDKKGIDIFEGDILKTATDKPMIVGWSDKFASFVLNRSGWAFSHWFGESCNPEDCEVIGNKYDNPELLQDVV